MEEVFQKVGDSALSIVILTTWVTYLLRQNDKIQTRVNMCIQRFEQHLQNHEKID